MTKVPATTTSLVPPWDAAETAQGRPIDAVWTFEVGATVRELWPFLTDTSSFNQRLGLSEMHFEEVDGRLRGRQRVAGMQLEWEEVPWEWDFGRGLSNARIYGRGLSHIVRARYRVESIGDTRTRLTIYIGSIPRTWWTRLLLHVGLRSLRAGFARALGEIAGEIAAYRDLAGTAPTPVRHPVELNRPRLDQVADLLTRDGVAPELLTRLRELVERAPDSELDRIRPRALARHWEMKLGPILEGFIRACHRGLLALTWDVVCPHCRGVRAELENLGSLPAGGRCDVCDIDFDVSDPNALEASFHLHPGIRDVPRRWYCAAEPATKPHILIQQRLAPGEERTLPTLLSDGIYRLRLRGGRAYRLLVLESEGTTDEVTWYGASGDSTDRIVRSPEPTLHLVNNTDETHTFVVAESAPDGDALRVSDVFDVPFFRDVFSTQAVAAGIRLDVGVRTVLFTDIVGSSRLYHEVGEATAFAQVRQHFVAVYGMVARHGGAVVKTIGDATMVSFKSEREAVAAAIELQRFFRPGNPETDLRIRISIHAGACYAVQLNSNVDYFGATVNLAAKLQAAVDAGAVVLTDAVQGAVEDLLAPFDTKALTFQTPWAGSGATIQVHHIQVS